MENKMYSLEIVNKAIETATMGFVFDHDSFKKNLKEFPVEIQVAIISSVLVGHAQLNLQMKKMASKLPEIEKKMKDMENPTKEDVDKLFKEAFDKMNKGE